MSSPTSASERVRAVLGVARRLATPGTDLHERARTVLVERGDLSAEGVDLALREHVETDATHEQLESIVRWAGAASRCHVVLSANVPVAIVRAVVLASAASSRVVLKPSRRDPGISALFAEALARDEGFASTGASVGLVEQLDAVPGDVVHVYGRDETVRAIRASLPAGVELRAHGTGLAIALVESDDPLEAAAHGLARDVVVFDQRGCLSPRIAIVGGGVHEAERFGRLLHQELAAYDHSVPRGPLDAATSSAVNRYALLLEAIGRALRGRGHVVGLDLTPVRLELGPEARVVHVASAEPHELAALLRPFAGHVTALGLARDLDAPGPLARKTALLLPEVRWARLGELQKPPLDGPVDRREG